MAEQAQSAFFAVQLAKLQGAHVIATASAANIDFVKQIGADEVIDYRERRFEEAGRVKVAPNVKTKNRSGIS